MFWKRGEWVKLTPAQVNQGEFMVEFVYAEPFRTIRLRLDFPHDPSQILELYEIELEQ